MRISGMKGIFTWLLASLLAMGMFRAAAAETPDLKYGLYIHYGMDTFRHSGETGRLPAERFAPASVDVKAWARAAKEAGMTFVVLTVKHESGFCLWDSPDYDYDIAHSAFKGDLMADFIAACEAEGVLPGVHYSIPDAYNEGAVRFKGDVPPPYYNFIKKQITELHTKYPGLRIQIFDGSPRLSLAQWGELCQIVRRLNPKCVIMDHVREGGVHHINATVNKGWMWQPDAQLFPTTQLFDQYNKAQAAHQIFLLNVGPAPAGNIPEDQLAELMELKRLMASGQTAAAPAAGKQDATERLRQVKALYSQGLISKDDYDQKVKAILDSL